MKFQLPKWLQREDIQPYLFIRKENASVFPGSSHPIDWFENKKPIILNPLENKNLDFANAIISLEGANFGGANMEMDRWVFYDCAVMPGLIAGFAMKRESLTPNMIKILNPPASLEWVPISLFICIPTVYTGQWVAHNLCSLNKLVDKSEGLRGLGFLTKAYGLWYANIKNLCGITQWHSPAMKLHSHYGSFEVITSYTPIHTYPNTLTYKSWVDSRVWHRFFTKTPSQEFAEFFHYAGFEVDPREVDSLKSFQSKIESGEGPFYLSEHEIREKESLAKLRVYRLNDHRKGF